MWQTVTLNLNRKTIHSLKHIFVKKKKMNNLWMISCSCNALLTKNRMLMCMLDKIECEWRANKFKLNYSNAKKRKRKNKLGNVHPIWPIHCYLSNSPQILSMTERMEHKKKGFMICQTFIYINKPQHNRQEGIRIKKITNL